MVEIHRNIVGANIGRHCNNRGLINLANQVTGRYAIKIRHNDIHKDQIISRALVYLRNSLKTVELYMLAKTIIRRKLGGTHSTVYMAMERVQELAPYSTTSLVIFYKKDLRRSNPSWIYLSASLPVLCKCSSRIVLCWHRVRNVIDMFAIPWIYTVILSDGVYEIIQVM